MRVLGKYWMNFNQIWYADNLWHLPGQNLGQHDVNPEDQKSHFSWKLHIKKYGGKGGNPGSNKWVWWSF